MSTASNSDANREDDVIIQNISALISEEHSLRERSEGHQGLRSDERARVRALEVQLDQCWDLLRQRRAKIEFGRNPDEAHVRPADEVERYQS